MAKDLLRKYAGNVPRYTSYPTAPHFNDAVGPEAYGRWLSELGAADRLSLYIHIPFCDRLCWFCACHTKQTLKYAPVAAYLQALHAEIATVGACVDRAARVTAIHLGGGSPTLLEPADVIALKVAIGEAFALDEAVEFSVEMDPNDLDTPRYDALGAIGMTRASLGVQDFDPAVQKAINRLQTFEQTRSVVEAVRARGVRSVNCDIVYGLPHQTMTTLEDTVAKIISLSPDRVALFGYAHVPWMKRHQQMIPDESLPDADLRFDLMTRASEMLGEAGYAAIGIDHFARPVDSLATAADEGRLRRNFQGYTDDPATAIIGLGASSIGLLPKGYVQNVPATGIYEKSVLDGRLAAVRGFALQAEDRMRAWVIERIMCDFGFDAAELSSRFGHPAATVLAEAQALAAEDPMVRFEHGRFEILHRARPFARSIAARFDVYFGAGGARHSAAV
ncbi:MAG: oxygen-independent coproporphyrinogen III oxidase [Rhizobium sp.]|nr:oxygen-independent coproporphyrinogen III oxidase [Rhizobium sp.]